MNTLIRACAKRFVTRPGQNHNAGVSVRREVSKDHSDLDQELLGQSVHTLGPIQRQLRDAERAHVSAR